MIVNLQIIMAVSLFALGLTSFVAGLRTVLTKEYQDALKGLSEQSPRIYSKALTEVAVGPVIEQLAAESNDSFRVAKLNVDDSPDVAAAYGVRSIPTLMIFKGGEVVDRFVGVQPKAVLQLDLEEAMR